jgi:hypothetical protein
VPGNTAWGDDDEERVGQQRAGDGGGRREYYPPGGWLLVAGREVQVDEAEGLTEHEQTLLIA